MNRSNFPVSVFCKTILTLVFSGFAAQSAQAIPAFSTRERVSCTMCHTNSSAPTLTHYGYLYRRAGFRPPTSIGNRDADAKAMVIQDHASVDVNVDYEYVNNKPVGASKSNVISNNINVPEVVIWPVAGAFLGNYGAWSELDASPPTSGGGGVTLSQADLRYVYGSEGLFINFRGGMIAPEGFGASDQWFDDSNLPLFDRLTAYYNQDTLGLPFGAMQQSELGAELGLNYVNSHLTLGIYNGFTGVNTTKTAAVPLTPLLASQRNDYKAQLDQFVGEIGAITAAYYHGYIPLMDPTGAAFSWADHYETGRLYLTWFALPSSLDILAGGAIARNQYVTTSPTSNGTFESRGAFFGTNWYVMPHLSLGARYDWNGFNITKTLPNQANGFSLQVSLPFENNIFVIRFNRTHSDLSDGDLLAGTTNDFRSEWRFMF